MKTRRGFLVLGSAVLCTFTMPAALHAQKKAAKIHRIGFLIPGTVAATTHFQEAFKQGLREQGYVEGGNVIVERRYAEGAVERLADLAADLVRIKVDVIVTATDPAVAAVKERTRTIPIVMVGTTDPVATGFVASLARPGGNITGLTTMSPELMGKRLELLKEIIPTLAKVALLWNPDVRGAMFDYNETVAAARTLRLQLQSIEMRRAEDLERVFTELTNGRAEALIVPAANPVTFSIRNQIVSRAQKNRLPSMYSQREYADAGGLISYGSSAADSFVQAVRYVDKILKGAKPADLPVEQPTKFELVVNMKTAKALGLTIPQTILVRADRVIE